MQLYRMLWIYIAVHDLGRANAARGTSKAWNPAYRKAAIRIAQELTPLLVAGGELDIEQVEAGKITSHCLSNWEGPLRSRWRIPCSCPYAAAKLSKKQPVVGCGFAVR